MARWSVRVVVECDEKVAVGCPHFIGTALVARDFGASANVFFLC